MRREGKERCHEPWVHVVKKTEISASKTLLLSILAVFASLVAGGLFILAIGQNPFSVYATIVKGAWRSSIARKGTIKLAVPLLITALGIIPAFKMKLHCFMTIFRMGYCLFSCL